MTASSNKPPAAAQTGLYLATYQKFLTTQPFSIHTRRSYLSRTRLFCNFLLFNLEEASNQQGLRPLRQSNPEAEVELE